MRVRRATRPFLFLLLFAAAFRAPAAATTIDSLTTYGAFESGSVTIVLAYYDAAVQNESARGWIKESGAPEGSWSEFHPFVRYDGNHMTTSLFHLLPGSVYDVRVVLDDPDAGRDTAFASLATRPEYAIPPPLRTIPVASASELQSAIDAALPGDRIEIAPGEYFETVDLFFLDGSEAASIVLTAADSTLRPHLFRGIRIESSSHLVFDHLEVETIDPADPRIASPVSLGYGGIDFRGSHHVVVRKCYIHDCDEEGANGTYKANLFIEHNDENEGTDKNGYFLIEKNVIADEIHPAWAWDDTNSCAETPGQVYSGIKLGFKPGGFTIIRENFLYGCVDALSTGGDEGFDPPAPSDLDVLAAYPNRDVDVYDNTIYHNRDDAIELDGHTVNGRVFRNRIGECMNAISTAPVYPGPIFLAWNRIGGFKENAAKLNTGVAGETRHVFWYHNTAVQPQFLPKPNRWCFYRGMPGMTDEITFRNNLLVARTIVIDTDIYGYHRRHDLDFDHLYSYQSYLGAPYTGDLFIWGEETGEHEHYATFDDFRAGTGRETHGVWGEPIFRAAAPVPIVLPALHDADDCFDVNYFLDSFAVAAGSPGIDAGVLLPGIDDAHAGSAPDCGAFEFGAPSSVAESRPPLPFLTSSSRPNPFNPSVTIDVETKGEGGASFTPLPFTVTIHDLRGRKVRTLSGALSKDGTGRVVWNGEDEEGKRLASGLYLYAIRAGKRRGSGKMMLVK